MLNNLIVGLISQCIRISKYHIVYLKHNNNFVHQLHFSKASGKAKTGNKTKILFLWLTTKNFHVYKNNLKETLNIYIWTSWEKQTRENFLYVKSVCFCCNRHTYKAFWEPNERNLFLCGCSGIEGQIYLIRLDKKVARTESLSVHKISSHKELRKKTCIFKVESLIKYKAGGKRSWG